MYNGYTKESLIAKLSGDGFFAHDPNYIVATDEDGWMVEIEGGWIYLIVRTNDVICRYTKEKDVFHRYDNFMMSLPLSDISEVIVNTDDSPKPTKRALVFIQSDGKVRGRWPFNPVKDE